MAKPIVAIVGRPNVGKSTLFNKIVGQRLSIVEDTPGVTRDRIFGDAEWCGRKFSLVDTGGIEPASKDVILTQMREQAQIAIDSASAIIFVTDIRTGVTATDADVANILLKSGVPVVLCVNKCDTVGEPPAEFYEDYAQLENGVGMWRLFEQEFLAELDKPHRIYGSKKMDVVTGTLAAPLIEAMMAELHRQYPMIEVTVHPIQNKFFGGNVSVAGLVTATDILAQCKGKLQSSVLGVPEVMLRSERDMFLDSVTVDELAQQLGVKIEILPSGGGDEARALLRSGLHIARRRRE